MSRQSKALERLCATPPPSDFKWDRLVTVMKHLGYEVVKNKGSRRKFYNAELDLLINCHQPHPSPHVDKGCISNIVEHLRSNSVI